jgi:DNA-binding MarR family transcriptional regulator
MGPKLHNKEESIGYITGRAVLGLRRTLRKAFDSRGYDIGAEQWTLLLYLWERDGMSQQELADISGKEKTAATRIIQALEKKKLIYRLTDNKDRRSKRIYLTKKGKTMEKGLTQITRGVLERVQEGISSEDLAVAKTVLKRIIRNTSD